MTLTAFVLVLWATGIGAWDFARRRVPNFGLLLLLIPAVSALVLRDSGLLGVDPATSLLGGVLPLMLMLPAYGHGWLGAGDVKLAAAMGLVLGPSPLALVLLLAALLLGGASLWALYRGRSRDARMPTAPMLATAFGSVLALAAFA